MWKRIPRELIHLHYAYGDNPMEGAFNNFTPQVGLTLNFIADFSSTCLKSICWKLDHLGWETNFKVNVEIQESALQILVLFFTVLKHIHTFAE